MIRLGIVGSTRGTLMLKLIEAIQQKLLDAEISIVLSNKPDAMILENAKKAGLKAEFVNVAELGDAVITEKLKRYNVDLVVLVGYMRILSKNFIEVWANKVINVHPSLLPDFAGKMDRQVHQAVLDAKVTETGCSVHYVTEIVDAGPIVIQKKCNVLNTDDVESLRMRVQALEGVALVDAINSILKKASHESRSYTS